MAGLKRETRQDKVDWAADYTIDWATYQRMNFEANEAYDRDMEREERGLAPRHTPRANTFTEEEWQVLKQYANADRVRFYNGEELPI